MMSFKWVARVRIVANLVLGTLLLVSPSLPFDWLGEPTPRPEWIVGVVGVAMIYVALAHVASAIAPGMAMSSNLFILLPPILPIPLLTWLAASVPSRSALMLALYMTVFVVLLGRTFHRGWLGDLAPRP